MSGGGDTCIHGFDRGQGCEHCKSTRSMFISYVDKDGNPVPEGMIKTRVGFPEMDDLKAENQRLKAERDRAIQKHDGMVAALRELQQQLEEARGWSLEDRAKHFFKQPEVISKLSQIKDQVEAAWRDAFETARKHIQAVLTAQEEVENANYWLNKVRTDEDHEVATEQCNKADAAFEKALDEAKKFAEAYKYIPTSALKEGPEGQHG